MTDEQQWIKDATFVAHAREDVPALLADNEWLRAEVERLREAARPIPLSEREPEIGQTVILWNSRWKLWFVAIIANPTPIHADYTHWLPLPPDPTLSR